MAKDQISQASNQTDSGFGNVRQASDVNSISSILGAALFGITNINNLEALAKASTNSKKGSLANTLAIIGNTFNKDFISTIKRIEKGVNSTVKYLKFINENINKNIDKKFTKLYNNIDFDAFVGAMTKINDTSNSLKELLNTLNTGGINKLKELHTDLDNIKVVLNDYILKEIQAIKTIFDGQPKAPTAGDSDNANIVSTQQTLNIVVTGVNNESLDLVKQLANVKLDEKSLLSAESIDKLIEVYKKIDELFKLQVTIEANAKASSNVSKSIQDTLDKVAESAVTAKQKQKDIEDTDASLEAIMNFITGATFVLVIGATVMMIPGMVEASLKFAGVLTVFIAAILTPILLLHVVQKALGNKFVKDKKGNDIPENINLLNGFVAACGFTMMIGALFMLIPGMVENSLKFAVVLTLFIAGVSLAIRLLPKDKTIMENLKQFASLITVCSFVMIFGALVMMLGGGKFIKNALLFGVTLGLFIFLVLGPIMLFSKLFGPATLQLAEFNKVIIVAAVTMLIGAAVMMLGGGKYVKYALQFGAVLGLFIAMVIAPTLLLNIFGKTSTDAIKRLTTLIIVSTIVLMLGAYFMTTKYPIYALAFTGLLSLFITAIILPLLVLGILARPALSAIKHLTVLILVSTICLLIGSYFMQDEKRAWSALAFTGLMAAFMLAIVGPLIFFKSKIAQSIPIAYSLALLVVACTASLVIGAWAMNEFGFLNILGFGALLLGFIFCILKVYDYVLSKSKTIKMAIPLMKEISLSLLALTGVIGIATAIGKIFGWDNVAIAIGMLAVVSFGFVALYNTLDLAKNSITGGAIVMLEIAGSIGILVAALTITTWLVDTYNAKTIVGGLLTLAGTATIFWGLYAALSHASKDVTTGAVVMLEIAASVAILAGVLTLTTWLVDTYDAGTIWGGLGVLVGAATIFGTLYFLLTRITNTVSTGAIVLLAIAASVAVLAGVLALTTWLFDTYGWEGIGGGLTALAGTAIIFGALYGGLSLIGPVVGIGSVVLLSIAASVGVLTLVVWGLCALVEKYTKEKIENAPKVLVSFVIGLGDLFWEIIKLSPTAILTTVALPFILPPVLGIATILTAIGRSVKIYKSAGKIDIEGIKKTIEDFFTITDAMPDLATAVILSTKLSRMHELVKQINEIVYVLSDSVSNVANLKIATAWNSNGIATDYKYLTTEDFTIAATNIGLIFTTLAGAIKDTYDNNGPLFGNDFYNILYKIRLLADTEGYILSTLSDNLQSYANLLIPRKWNKNGEPIAFRTMTEEDFTNAAKGIAKVLTTMASAIWITYILNKDILFGDDFEDILENIKVLSVAEGEILSTLSEGLQAYTQLLIPTKWNNKGKAIGFRQMKDTDFIKAGENIGAVMVTMAGAIKAAWTGTDFTVNGITIKGQGGGLKELHSGGWLGTGVGDIIKELQPMGDLISSIAQGLCAYSQLLIPIDWNSKGRPTKFKQMDNTDIQLAGTNIGLVLTGLATSIKTAYDSMDSLFGDSVEDILSALMPMGELISNIAEGMSDYAELKFPEYDANGKIKGYKPFKNEDFTNAERNIGKVITGLAGSLKKAYEELPNDSADTIKNIIEAFVPIGDLISNISEGIAAYANAKIPKGFDKDGKPLGYVKIDDTLIDNCSKNIKAVLFATLFGNADAKSASDATGGIIGAYNILEQLNMHKKIDNILKSMMPVGEFISSMTDSISSFSKMQFPNAWDENGKPTSFLKISNEDIIDASGNIIKVIFATLFGLTKDDEDLSKITDKNSVNGGVIGAYNALQKMKLEDDIQEILESMMPVGELIGNMANGVSKFATLQIPIKWDPKTGNAIDYMKLSDSDFTTAGKNIKTVITTIFKAIPEIYKGNEYLFDTEDTNAPIVIVMDSVSKLGSAIKDIAEGVQTFANGGIPKFNNEGKIIGYTMFNETTGQKAASTIGKIMTTLSKAVVDVYNTNLKGKITTGDFAEAIAAIGGIGGAVKNIADGVQAYAELKMPTGWDKDGKPLGYKKLPKNFITNAKKNITSIIMSLSESLSEAWNGNGTKTGVKDLFKDNTLQSIITTVTDVNSVISIVGIMVTAISDMKVAEGFNAEGKPTGFKKLADSDLTNLYKKITDLLVALPKSVYDAYNNNKNKIYFENTDYISKVLKPLPTLGTLVKQITDIVNIIGETKISEIFKTNKRKAKNSEGKEIEFQVGAFKDIYIVTDEISTILQKLIGIPAIDKQLDTIDKSFSVLSSRINELSEAINNYYENKAFEENINRVSRFVSETVNTLDIEKIDHLLALIESMNRLSDKTTTLDSLTNAIANNLSVVLKQLADKMEEAKTTIKITEQMQAKRHKLINDSIATVKNIMSKEIIVTVNTATNDTTSSTDTGSYSPGGTPGSSNSGGLFGGSQMPNIGAGTGADISTFPSANTIDNAQQSNGKYNQIGNNNSHINTQTSTINDMSEKINTIYNIIKERF